MDADQLRELSTNALTGHWPAHLGLTTDADKIEYLARQLEGAAGDVGSREDENERLEDENKALEGRIESLKHQLTKAKESNG